ncbi:MAG: fucose isomerase, partial [Rhizobiaceae bacterium]|nr:fucose isomerase [Rhizobiaceae bacterium]
VPEPHTGGRLRLNSLCGINLAGHALTRAGYRYAYVYAEPTDPLALDVVTTRSQAGRVRRLLRGARIGRVGENPAGFETCLVNRAGLAERFGLEVVDIDLREQVFAAAQAIPQAEAQAIGAELATRVSGLADLDTSATEKTLKTYVTLKDMADSQRLQGFAVRCWPEFFTELGCAACGAMSLLSDGLTPSSCEVDVNGTITQFILQTLSGEPAFGSDLVSVDPEADALVLWHCGLAPLAMADPDTTPGVTIHSNRKLPLLLDFALKPGQVTVARLSEAAGDFRLVIGMGEIVRGRKPFSGTTGLLRLDRHADQILDRILAEGLEHHLSLTYGDHRPALRALAHMLNLPVYEL